MKCQLRVIKTDRSREEYLHTKVIGTINNALVCAGEADMRVAEELAEVVTYFLYHRKNKNTPTTGEIFSIIKTALATAGCEKAAIALDERHYQRRLKRSRIEVVMADIHDLADVRMLASEKIYDKSRWNKSVIVNDLVDRHGIARCTARVVASMVEEKVLAMKISSVPASLVKQLVLNDLAVILHADNQLQKAHSMSENLSLRIES